MDGLHTPLRLYHRRNEISIDFGSIQDPAAIEITYRGRMVAESMLPDDWFLIANNKKILCASFGSSIPELLMNYTGIIKILGVTITLKSFEQYDLDISIEDIDYWENINSDYDKNTQYWEGLGSTHEKLPNLKNTSIVRNNLSTNPGEFGFKDGTPYEGEYHQHQNTQAMTGAEHSEDSVLIYRLDALGQIYDPSKHITKNEAMSIIKKHDIKITRGTTKSDYQKIKEGSKMMGFGRTKLSKDEPSDVARRVEPTIRPTTRKVITKKKGY